MDKKVINYLKSKSINVLSNSEAEGLMEIWRQWYKGKVDKFHKYKVYTGKRKLEQERKTLNMGAEACQKWADLLLNEKVQIHTSDENTTALLDRLLNQVNFYIRGNNLIELAFALGGGFFVQYWDGNKTAQKYITQDKALPISWNSGELTEVAFVSNKIINRKRYVYIETHLLDDNGNYVIDNILAEENNNGSALVEAPKDVYNRINLEQKWETNSPKPKFQMIRPNVANKVDFDCPYGTSCFSGAVDVMKTIDCIFDSYFNEFILGRKRIFVKDGMARVQQNENGEDVEVFDPQDAVFYQLPDEDDTEAIHESNPQLRVAEHTEALEKQLAVFSRKCGFGSDGFKWENGSVTTATQVISENSDEFRTLKKHEIILNQAITAMCFGLLEVEASNSGISYPEDLTITVDFDDSIIEDTGEQQRRSLIELQNGVIDRVQYLIETRKMSEEEALNFIAKIDGRNPITEEPELE